jgi:hypothetical protein
MELRTELAEKWRQAMLSVSGGAEWRAILLTVPANIRILAGVREPDGRMAVLFETSIENAPAKLLRLQADGISLSDQRCHEEGLLRLAVTLEHHNLRDVFEVLALDLIDVARHALSATTALTAVTRRLEAWQACLRVRRQRLSREQQIGLLGELVIYREIASRLGHSLSIEAWQGPLDGIHDFSRAGAALEVKSVLGVGSLVQISHLDQLETDGITGLAIARVRFAEASDGLSLAEVIGALRILIDQEAPHARGEFEDRLLRAGWHDFGDTEETLRAVVQDQRIYEVREGFPRLTREVVPPGITDVSYSVDERMLEPFKMNPEAAFAFLDLMKGSPT